LYSTVLAATLFEGFETGPLKQAYAVASTGLYQTGSWTLGPNVLLYGPTTTAPDKCDGQSTRCLRGLAPGTLTMNFDVPHLQTVQVHHQRYNDAQPGGWTLWGSADHGTSWKALHTVAVTPSNRTRTTIMTPSPIARIRVTF
jgi:hypothetical protein